MFCKNCGAPLTPEKRFCSQCGTAVKTETPVTLEAKVELTPNLTPNTPSAQPMTNAQQSASNPTPDTPSAQPMTNAQQSASNPTPDTPSAQPMTNAQQSASNPTPDTQNAQFTQNPQTPPQMTWQEWQNWQNWQNAQNTKSSSINLSDGIQRMQESDSFVFRSLGLTLKTLFSKPILLWGLSLLGVILKVCAKVLCSIPMILGLSVSQTLSAGMDCVFLDAYNGKVVNSKQIFAGFSSGKSFFRIAGGMLWKSLWLIIWGLLLIIPPVGIGVLIYKGLSYSFTPYILLKKQDLSPLDALKRSMQLTKGYKGKIFVTYLLVAAAFLLIALIAFLFSQIPAIGGVIAILITLVVAVLSPLFFGVLRAAMFTEVLRLEKIEDIEL